MRAPDTQRGLFKAKTPYEVGAAKLPSDEGVLRVSGGCDEGVMNPSLVPNLVPNWHLEPTQALTNL